MDKYLKPLFKPVDISSLVFFRIGFGLILCWEVLRYFNYDWIRKYWIEPDFYFTFSGFSWVSPWDGNGMYLHFFMLGVLAIFIMLGFMYRMSAVLFFLGFSYVFLLDRCHYLNHFYLICLLAFIMIFLPTHRSLSIDAKLRPAIRQETVPAWMLYFLCFQIGIVYFYGGVAKLNADWLQGEPMRMWLANRTDFPLIGAYFTREWMVDIFSFGGLLLDLLIVPFLIWPRTRIWAFLAGVSFHLLNSQLFSIGIFPWFMIAATTIFFRPDWFRNVVNLFGERWPASPEVSVGLPSVNFRVLLLPALYVFIQLLLPLRHHLCPGNVNWTEEGHRFAWHMKLRTKKARAKFYVIHPETSKKINISTEKYLTKRQDRKMRSRPDMILQFAQHLADVYEKKWKIRPIVKTKTRAKLNGRDYQYLIDPEANLADISYFTCPADWIVPLTKELPEK